MSISNLSSSYKAILFIAIFTLAAFFASGRWFRSKVIDADVVSYYSYLPAVIIHGDLTMNYAVGNDFYADKVWGIFWKEHSGPVQKYTMGMSWLYAPFFLLGHGTALLFGFPAHGYSSPYNFWMQFGALVYLYLGLRWLRKVLLQFYSEGITALTLLILALGTNLFYYSLGQATMPHVYLFALISGLLWQTIRFYAQPNWGRALAIGLICSVITLARPNQILLWLIPVLYGITNKETLMGRMSFWKANWSKLLISPILQALVILPQIYYWHLLTDRWIYYSYTDESFFWLQPMVWKVLFSFRNGWLIYSPLMLLGLLGIFRLARHAPPFRFVAPLVMVMATYVISAWWCWWYGGSFGSRAFIDYYPLLALGISALLTQIGQWFSTLKARRIALGMLAFFLILNLFQTFQYTRGIIHYDSMTAKVYWNVFARDRMSKAVSNYLEAPDYEAAKAGNR